MPAWPGSVNQLAYRDSFAEDQEHDKAVFQPEVGDPVERVRSSIARDILSWNGRGTLTEFDALKSFYRTDCKMGVLTVTRNDPLRGTSGTFKWVEPPKLVRVRREPTILEWRIVMRKVA